MSADSLSAVCENVDITDRLHGKTFHPWALALFILVYARVRVCWQIVADIYEPQGLAFVDTTASFLTNDLLSLVETTIADTKVKTGFFWSEFSQKSFLFNHKCCSLESCVLQAHISFSPTLEQQQKCAGCEGTIIDGDFIIKYDVKREKTLGDIQVRRVLAAALETQSDHLLWDCRNNVFFLL